MQRKKRIFWILNLFVNLHKAKIFKYFTYLFLYIKLVLILEGIFSCLLYKILLYCQLLFSIPCSTLSIYHLNISLKYVGYIKSWPIIIIHVCLSFTIYGICLYFLPKTKVLQIKYSLKKMKLLSLKILLIGKCNSTIDNQNIFSIYRARFK